MLRGSDEVPGVEVTEHIENAAMWSNEATSSSLNKPASKHHTMHTNCMQLFSLFAQWMLLSYRIGAVTFPLAAAEPSV